MSPPPRVLLLDTNAYLRLALDFHPLFAGSHGQSPRHVFYVHADIDYEMRNSERIRTKFDWIGRATHVAERKARLFRLKPREEEAAHASFGFLASEARVRNLNVSRIDIRLLAVALTKQIVLVSDDGGVAELGRAFDVQIWSALAVLKMLFDTGAAGQEKVATAVQRWAYENELPCGKAELRKLYREYFGTDCPV